METNERARANSLGLSRRALLKAAPALALVGAVPAVAAQAETLTPLWREAEAIKAVLNHEDADLDSPEWMAGYDRLIALQDEIASTPARSLADWAAKVLNADDGGMFTGNNVWTDALLAEARALIGA